MTDSASLLGRPWRPSGSQWLLGVRSLEWVLYVPRDGNDTVTVSSSQQNDPNTTVDPDGTARLVWPTVTTSVGADLPITVTMSVDTADSRQRFRLHLDNRSDAVVASALYPVLHGIDVPGGRALSALTRDYYGAREHALWPEFAWNKPYYGTVRPTLMTDSLVFGNPTAPFAVMTDGQETVAATVTTDTAAATSWLWELEPGYTDTIGEHTPSQQAGGELTFSAVHLLDLSPGAETDLAEITLDHVTTGGWQQALTPYRLWHQRRVAAARTRTSWADHPQTWFQVGLNSSAGERRYRFTDLPRLAAQCRDHDVDVLHVIGWNTGGQDRNNPCHDPDPDLGGPETLARAIDECHALGVRVVLFTKFTWADQGTDRFRTSLINSAVRNPYGDYYPGPAYQYLTPHQWLDVNPRRLIPMCFLHEAYLQVCETEFDKVIATGADGMLFDEAMHHTPGTLCYARNHGHRPGASVYAGDVVLARRLRARLPADRQDFLFAAETVYEGLQPYYDVSYIRSHYPDHVPFTRYLNPRLRLLTTVTGIDDRNQINQALTYGYQLCYEPRHFKGELTDMPRTVDYGRRAETMRRELVSTIWDGNYLGDAPLTAEPAKDLASATWQGPDGPVYLIANYRDQPRSAELNAKVTQHRTVDLDWQPTTSSLTLPARSLTALR